MHAPYCQPCECSRVHVPSRAPVRPSVCSMRPCAVYTVSESARQVPHLPAHAVWQHCARLSARKLVNERMRTRTCQRVHA
eukprot:7123509-Alexandrium_andersonii.AAC.1